MNQPDYDTWNYWFAFWVDEHRTKLNYTIVRTPQTVPMVDMMKQFMQKQPKMDFKPTHMFMGRVLDSKLGRQYYENDQYKEAMQSVLSNDTNMVADVCVVKLIEAKSQAEFNSFRRNNPGGYSLGNLDELIQKSRKR